MSHTGSGLHASDPLYAMSQVIAGRDFIVSHNRVDTPTLWQYIAPYLFVCEV